MFFLTRRQIAVLLSALCVSQVCSSPSRRFEETKPNFVIFFADDVSYAPTTMRKYS